MTNSVDPDQTGPIGAALSGSTLFASILKLVSNVRQLFAADDLSRHHFQMHFFFCANRVNSKIKFLLKPLPRWRSMATCFSSIVSFLDVNLKNSNTTTTISLEQRDTHVHLQIL